MTLAADIKVKPSLISHRNFSIANSNSMIEVQYLLIITQWWLYQCNRCYIQSRKCQYHMWRQDMGCLLWVQSLVHIPLEWLYCCIQNNMLYLFPPTTHTTPPQKKTPNHLHHRNVNELYKMQTYRKVSNIRCTKSQILNDSRLLLHLSLPNRLKPSVKSRMKM